MVGGPHEFRVFFFNDTATTEIYTLSLHDALPIYGAYSVFEVDHAVHHELADKEPNRSEEHTSELQSPDHLVCRLLLEKKKIYAKNTAHRSKPSARRPRRCQRPLLASPSRHAFGPS